MKNKLAILLLLLAPLSLKAQSITATRLGNTTFYSNGVSSTQVGSHTFYSNGMSATQIGSTTFYNNVPTCPRPGYVGGFR